MIFRFVQCIQHRPEKTLRISVLYIYDTQCFAARNAGVGM